MQAIHSHRPSVPIHEPKPPENTSVPSPSLTEAGLAPAQQEKALTEYKVAKTSVVPNLKDTSQIPGLIPDDDIVSMPSLSFTNGKEYQLLEPIPDQVWCEFKTQSANRAEKTKCTLSNFDDKERAFTIKLEKELYFGEWGATYSGLVTKGQTIEEPTRVVFDFFFDEDLDENKSPFELYMSTNRLIPRLVSNITPSNSR